MEGIMHDRMTRVSKSRPKAIVVPICPTMTNSLTTMDAMVKANTRPAEVTTARSHHHIFSAFAWPNSVLPHSKR